MRANVVFTLSGKDRIGLVEEVTDLLLKYEGNVETSRMARLGGEFAILMLVSIPTEQQVKLDSITQSYRAQGYQVTTSQTDHTYAAVHSGWKPFKVEVHGADHEGIIHQVARNLSQRGISIESMDTFTTPAPMNGSPLFTMTAQVVVPPTLTDQGWEADLDDAGDQLGVDIHVSPLNT